MALRLQIEKQKKQEEMRRIMTERKRKHIKPTIICNPLAKYNNTGQLMCILCNSVVRSEHVWQVHMNSKQHRENVEKAKQLKELTNNFTVGKIKHKSGSPLSDGPPVKRLKGILKNAETQMPPISKNTAPQVISFHDEEIKRTPLNLSTPPLSNEDVPATSTSEAEGAQGPEQPIPEGFFDDPILDAKVRNIEYKNPIEEEWDKFQKEIKEEATASAEIIAGEQEEATAERQIDEIDEQIRIWSKVLDLELKKEETKKTKQDMEKMSEDDHGDSDNEDDIDEFLDWRAKKSYT